MNLETGEAKQLLVTNCYDTWGCSVIVTPCDMTHMDLFGRPAHMMSNVIWITYLHRLLGRSSTCGISCTCLLRGSSGLQADSQVIQVPVVFGQVPVLLGVSTLVEPEGIAKLLSIRFFSRDLYVVFVNACGMFGFAFQQVLKLLQFLTYICRHIWLPRQTFVWPGFTAREYDGSRISSSKVLNIILKEVHPPAWCAGGGYP